MLFLKKKEETSRSIPVERIRDMSQKGVADKDIIKQLKSEGYVYPEIEKAMLGAVKQGVTSEEAPMLKPPEPYMPALERTYGSEPVEEPTPEMSELFSTPLETPEDIPTEELSPEIAIEELIEGVVEDKLSDIQNELQKIKEEQQRQALILKKHDQSFEQRPTEINTDVTEFSQRMEDLEARVGGLERAFKQFLPSLIQNIESLSQMVREMKQLPREAQEKTGI